MALNTHYELKMLCYQQNVALDSRLIKSEYSFGYDLEYDYAACGPLDYTITVAGDIMRQDPQERLAQGHLSIPVGSDIGLKTLAGIVNDSQRPRRESTIVCSEGQTLNVCDDFEMHWTDMLRQTISGQPLTGDLIQDADANPLFFIKNRHVPSALALAETTINGIRYPEGSIMRVDTSEAAVRDNGLLDRPKPSRTELRIVSAEEIVKASFLRLSGFAYTPQQRRDMKFIHPSENTPEEMFIRTLPFSAIVDLVGQAALS